MKLCYVIIAFIFFAISSCNCNSKKEIVISKTTTLIDTPKSIQEELESSSIKIDSSKLIKGFDDIFFGTKSEQTIYNYFNKVYTINNIKFNFDSDAYYSSIKYGLYKFSLTSQKVYDFKLMPNLIHEIKDIIEESYPTGKKIKEINESPYGLMERRLKAMNTNVKKIPVDYLSREFIFQFIKNDICIKLGYEIGYRPENQNPIDFSYETNFHKSIDLIDLNSNSNYTKYFAPVISFTYLPEFLSVEKRGDSIEINAQKEKKKRDASKF